MKSAIFSVLVWGVSSTAISVRAAALSSSGHMLRTLRGGAIATFINGAALQLLWREPLTRESTGRQVRSALLAFALFFVLITVLVVFLSSSLAPWATILTFLGGVVLPVMSIMALEFHDLRRPAVAAGAIIIGTLGSVAFINALVRIPAQRPGIIRTNQPSGAGEEIRQTNRPERA